MINYLGRGAPISFILNKFFLVVAVCVSLPHSQQPDHQGHNMVCSPAEYWDQYARNIDGAREIWGHKLIHKSNPHVSVV